MMYRRNANLTPRPAASVIAAGQSFATMAASKVLEFLAGMGIIDIAERENRRRNRVAKRHLKHTTYFAAGLNGERAMARRRRQREKIEARKAALVASPSIVPESERVVSSYALSFT